MDDDSPHLKLGKGVAFVKTHLRRLPQGDDLWEADFMEALDPLDARVTVWLGLIVHQDGWIVRECTVDQPPTVNDMAGLLAQAMQGPYDEDARRPHTIRFRAGREWPELHPHLTQLGVKVISAPRLAKWDKEFKRMRREAADYQANVSESELEGE